MKLNTTKRRIDFEMGCRGAALAGLACGVGEQLVHDRPRRSWHHLDFCQFEAWLHCVVPRVACGGGGKTTQAPVVWAPPVSGFTAAVEALALALCRELLMRQAATLLRCTDNQLWRRIDFYVRQARRQPLPEKVCAIDPKASLIPDKIYCRRYRVRQTFTRWLARAQSEKYVKPGMFTDAEINLK